MGSAYNRVIETRKELTKQGVQIGIAEKTPDVEITDCA